MPSRFSAAADHQLGGTKSLDLLSARQPRLIDVGGSGCDAKATASSSSASIEYNEMPAKQSLRCLFFSDVHARLGCILLSTRRQFATAATIMALYHVT
ncbi:hypothetical protein V7S43_009287 [Phytophthora oleae]|uniref:Uncharacterized protein n=1 Tax=Phytophthora oleae TaxID=2107226 RepID=A0ABD3FGH0_9STRA